MALESEYFFQVVTGNPLRARTLQNKAIPGRRSIHIPFSSVDEEEAKTIANGSQVSLREAIGEVTRISEHKALRDWEAIGGAPGAVSQLTHVGKESSVVDGFTHIARLTSDTIRVVFASEDRVEVFNKIPGPDMYDVAERMSGKKTALLTALTRIISPLSARLNSDVETVADHMRTVVVMTEYWLRPFSQQEYVAYAEDRGVEVLRQISGALPFENNPFIDASKGFQVVIYDTQEHSEVLLSGTMWSLLDRQQCIHGAFPEAVEPLLVGPGAPLPPGGESH